MEEVRILNQHYCNLHHSRFYKNERKDYKGDLKIWYSHKLLDGQGFCVEKGLNDLSKKTENPVNGKQLSLVDDAPKGVNGMLMCNAMNNAVSLAASGKISTDQIGSYYKRILSELMATT